MYPLIDKTRCAAQPDICPPIKSCPTAALRYVEDDAEPLGGWMELDQSACNGCGDCVALCCGNCIEMKEA